MGLTKIKDNFFLPLSVNFHCVNKTVEITETNEQHTNIKKSLSLTILVGAIWIVYDVFRVLWFCLPNFFSSFFISPSVFVLTIRLLFAYIECAERNTNRKHSYSCAAQTERTQSSICFGFIAGCKRNAETICWQHFFFKILFAGKAVKSLKGACKSFWAIFFAKYDI